MSFLSIAAVYLFAAYAEETGWTSLLTKKLLSDAKTNTWRVGLIAGAVWAIWHLIPFIQTGNTASWIVAQTVWTMLFRICIVWVYDRTGKHATAATWIHATYNISFSALAFIGLVYNPWLTSLAMTFLLCLFALYDFRLSKRKRLLQ